MQVYCLLGSRIADINAVSFLQFNLNMNAFVETKKIIIIIIIIIKTLFNEGYKIYWLPSSLQFGPP